MKTLIFGYGNMDRQDDGVAWHILRELMNRYNILSDEEVDIYCVEDTREVDFIFQFQLTPEIADDLQHYAKVCFIDAHTGAVPEEIHAERVTPKFQQSPFTHHMTPASLLSIAETLHHQVPDSLLVSVRGYEFGFAQSLSEKTAALVLQAADKIQAWIEN